MNDTSTLKAVINFDMSSYGKVSGPLEAGLATGGAARVLQLNEEIENMMCDAISQAAETAAYKIQPGGDGGIVLLDSLEVAHRAAENLHALATKFNGGRPEEIQRHFRVVICYGEVAVRSDSGSDDGKGPRFGGNVIVRSSRLLDKKVCRTGEVIIESDALKQIENLNKDYGPAEIIKGKHPSEIITAHRRTVVKPAPWQTILTDAPQETLRTVLVVLLRKAFSPEELRGFLFREYGDVHGNIGPEMTMDSVRILLIQYAEQRCMIKSLQNQIMQERPEIYSMFSQRISDSIK